MHFRLLFFSIFVKNVLWILTGVAMNVYISLGNMGFLILLILLTHEHRIVFISLCLLQSPSTMSNSFHVQVFCLLS